MKQWLVAAFLLIGTSAYAHQAVSEIPFDGDINSLKPPRDIHGGEVSVVADSIACPSENNFLVGELLNCRMQKLTLRPAASSTASR